MLVALFYGGLLMSFQNIKKAIKFEVDLMEKEIVYLKGRRRQKARKAYFKLLHLCDKTCEIGEPIYLVRS